MGVNLKKILSHVALWKNHAHSIMASAKMMMNVKAVLFATKMIGGPFVLVGFLPMQAVVQNHFNLVSSILTSVPQKTLPSAVVYY